MPRAGRGGEVCCFSPVSFGCPVVLWGDDLTVPLEVALACGGVPNLTWLLEEVLFMPTALKTLEPE